VGKVVSFPLHCAISKIVVLMGMAWKDVVRAMIVDLW
jgi:hypothetical protein